MDVRTHGRAREHRRARSQAKFTFYPKHRGDVSGRGGRLEYFPTIISEPCHDESAVPLLPTILSIPLPPLATDLRGSRMLVPRQTKMRRG